jgi:hypothetical protein
LITRPTLLTPISDKKGINIDLCLSFLRGLPLGHYSALVRMCSQLKCILSYISFNEYELKIISVSRKFDVSTIVDSPFFMNGIFTQMSQTPKYKASQSTRQWLWVSQK